MIIECVPVPGRKLLMSILCDGEVWRTIHTSIFGKKPSLPKYCDSLEEFSRLFDEAEYNMARQFVMRRLSAMSLPSTTIVRSLKQRLVSDSVIERVIENFKEVGYLNDEEWTKNFIRRQGEKKLGPRAIAQKLTQKGFDRDVVDEAMEASEAGAGGEAAQREAIAALIKTRFKKRDLTDFHEKQKVVAALARRGFDFSLILEVIGDL